MEHSAPLIAGTYRLTAEIGRGGGGVVYLGEHIRLGKQVVLKADKRATTVKPEILRREVDALKNLNHTYIPQVFDFIQENGITYTVMDFVEGYSFDKPLKHGVRFTQVQVIEWACQLLEALTYLHSRPPYGILHADIKPSNVMLTPQGDVRLIDFNIALSLGAEGAVAVGRSFGYASPEHYGLDYSSGSATRGVHTDINTNVSADSVSYINTILESRPIQSHEGSTSSKKTIMLNVRSDIYSLGATLYHIMTGIRPEQDATKVKPISTKEFSPAVVKIIAKAMNPNPDLRWQSSEEMLHAFRNLHENDPRTVRRKRITAIASILLVLLFFAGVGTTFAGQRLMQEEQREVAQAALILGEEQREAAQAAQEQEEEQRRIADEQRQLALINEARVLAEYSGNALRSGDVDAAVEYALQALSDANIPEAMRALADALGVYDLSDGFRNHRTLELPSSPLYMAISPDGNTAVAIHGSALVVFCTYSADVLATLPPRGSALAEVAFLSNDVIIYAGEVGITAHNIRNNTTLWTGLPATGISISADRSSVAAIYRNQDFALIYDTATGNILHEISFGGMHQRVVVNDIFANPGDNLFALNRDGTMLGVSFACGSLWVFDLHNRSGDIEIFDNTSGFTRFSGGFNREFFAFAASGSSQFLYAVINTIELWEEVSGSDTRSPFRVQANESGIFVQTENNINSIHLDIQELRPLVTTLERERVHDFAVDGTHTLMTTQDQFMFFDRNARLLARHQKEHGSEILRLAEGTALIGSLDSPVIRIMRLESHPEANVFTYDPNYRHDEARISANGQRVMLFSFRGFRVFDIGGGLIAEVEMQNPAYVHDQIFVRDAYGCRLEVIYNDGTIRMYSAIDGSFVSQAAGDVPDLTLFEVHYTDIFRIESPLHGVPRVYNIATGEFVRELEREAFLTYVTQIGEYTLTEYVTGEGYRFGLLLNADLDAIAYLPHLSDFIDGYLIFNYATGNLRRSRIYTIEELIALGQ